jgi:hypothetical protein
MSRLRHSLRKKKSDAHDEQPIYLPMRWVIILLVAGLASVVIYRATGVSAAITGFFMIIAALNAVMS